MKSARLSLLVVAGMSISFIQEGAQAGSPGCHVHSLGPYCAYSGTVARLYVNHADEVLLYFDTPLDLNEPASVGITGVTQTSAAVISFEENPEFSKFFYVTALAAQARGALISIQMRGVRGGYLKIDRIWIHE